MHWRGKSRFRLALSRAQLLLLAGECESAQTRRKYMSSAFIEKGTSARHGAAAESRGGARA